MSKDLLNKLEDYRTKNSLTYLQLSQRLQIPENYIYRWRKKGEVKGVYKRIIEEFLGS